MNERIEVVVRGRVQLVMYRDFSERKARRLRIVGEVQNLKDGTVRICAEGPREQLESYIQKLAHGPLLARVDSLDISWLPATGEYTTFTIVYE